MQCEFVLKLVTDEQSDERTGSRSTVNSLYRAGNTIFKVGGPKHNLFLDVIIFLLKR